MSTGKQFRPYQPRQMMLLPPSLYDWLPRDHPVYFIDEVVDQLDLSAIYAAYRGPRGYPPYDPRMMVKVWFYAYWRGIHSSRKLERALHEDVGFRTLSGNQQPDHWTLSEFRRRHHQALGELFEQTVQLAARAGLVKLRHVAVDGTKVKAYASKHSAMSYGRMKREEDRLRAEIEAYLQRVEEQDHRDDEELGDRRGWELPPELADRQRRLEAIRRAKAELEAEWRARRETESGRRGDGNRFSGGNGTGEPPAKAQRNFTDPESRIMRDSDGSFVQAYNAQVAVDAETQVIVAAEVTNQAADNPHLPALVEQVERNTGRRPRELSADAGYFSERNLTLLGERGIEAFIPPDKVRHSEWRETRAPRGRLPRSLSLRERMRRKLRTRWGRARYKLRHCSVEPVFGQIKGAMGLRQFLLRGLAKVRALWLLQCAVHNLRKLFAAGVRFYRDQMLIPIGASSKAAPRYAV